MSKKQILHFGLAATANISRETVQQQVTDGANKARDSGKYDVQLTFVEEDEESLDKAIAELRKELESGKWDALVVGGGLKGAPPMTPKFEQVVNLWGTVAAGRTKILFQMAPGDIYETVQRGFEQ